MRRTFRQRSSCRSEEYSSHAGLRFCGLEANASQESSLHSTRWILQNRGGCRRTCSYLRSYAAYILNVSP
jgi:hypothetical protein